MRWLSICPYFIIDFNIKYRYFSKEIKTNEIKIGLHLETFKKGEKIN